MLFIKVYKGVPKKEKIEGTSKVIMEICPCKGFINGNTVGGLSDGDDYIEVDGKKYYRAIIPAYETANTSFYVDQETYDILLK